MIAEGYRLQPFEEALGIVGEIQQYEGYAIAKIGPVSVVLPEEMVERLKGFIGQKVGVLRTDRDYRFRVISAPKADSAAQDAIKGIA
jgi:hypothetical protein